MQPMYKMYLTVCDKNTDNCAVVEYPMSFIIREDCHNKMVELVEMLWTSPFMDLVNSACVFLGTGA